MFDSDLKILYDTETKRINKAVIKNKTNSQKDLCFNYQMMKYKICGPKLGPQILIKNLEHYLMYLRNKGLQSLQQY